MSRRVSSPAGNYYKFVYDEDSDDDDNDDNDNNLPPISPVDEEPELLPETSPTALEVGERRQRLARLLGTEAILALDLADVDYADTDHHHQPLDNVHHRPPQLDENLNRKVGTFMSRAQDYSTTSLEFSDMESVVSDSVGRQSDEEDGGWSEQPGPRGGVDEQLQLDEEPVSFVEFTPAAVDDDHEDDADVEEQTGRKRRVGSKQPRYDQLVTVRYHREEFNNHDDFIDDDALLQRLPTANDFIVTSRSADVGGRQLSPMTSVLPVDVAELTMDDSCCEVHTARDRDPIVRVDDPDYDSGYSKSVAPCCCRPRMTWQRRLFVVAGSVALLTAAALLAILIFLVVTRP